MTNEQMPIKYDLEDRTAIFAEKVLEFVKSLSKDIISTPVISQLVRSSTSVGANYCEADCAESRKDFEHKIGICKKEAKESRYWLRLLANIFPARKDEIRLLWNESNELHLIFIAIVKSSKAKGS